MVLLDIMNRSNVSWRHEEADPFSQFLNSTGRGMCSCSDQKSFLLIALPLLAWRGRA